MKRRSITRQFTSDYQRDKPTGGLRRASQSTIVYNLTQIAICVHSQKYNNVPFLSRQFLHVFFPVVLSFGIPSIHEQHWYPRAQFDVHTIRILLAIGTAAAQLMTHSRIRIKPNVSSSFSASNRIIKNFSQNPHHQSITDQQQLVSIHMDVKDGRILLCFNSMRIGNAKHVERERESAKTTTAAASINP